MSENILPINRGIVRVAAVNFYATPARADGICIPLGSMVELVLPTLRGLGLVARTELTSFELDQLGELGRRILVSPFAMLSGEFESAWRDAPAGGVLSYLRKKHHHSVRFEHPSESTVPHRVFVGGQAVRPLVREFINTTLDDQAETLIPLHADPNTPLDNGTVAENTRLDPFPAAA